MKIIEYRVVSGKSLSVLEEDVNQVMKDHGYVPFGSLVVDIMSSRERFYYQPVVKYEREQS